MAKHVIQAVLELKDNFSSGILGAAKQAKKSGADISNEMLKSTKIVQQWASDFGKAVDNTILKLGNLAVAAGKAFVALSFNTGMEFEKGLDKVQATASLTTEQMDALEKKAREVAGSTKFSLGETADALYYMALAGWGNTGTEKMEAALPHMVNLSIASDTDIGTVSDIVTDAMTALKMQADETTTVLVDGVETQVNNVQHFADVLAKTSSSANTDVDMMGESFKQAAALSGSMGYSIDDLAVALGVMANAGVKGESSGTTLKNGITKLLSPTAQASALMEQYGVSLQNADGTGKTLMQLMENLRSSFGDLDVEVLDASGELRDGETLLEELGESGGVSAEQMAKIAAMSEIFGAKSLPGMLAMVQASEDDFSTLSAQIANCNGAAEEMAQTMGDNLAGDLDILSSTVGDAAWEFYKNIGGTAREAVQGLTAQIQELKENGTLQQWAQTAGEYVALAFQKIGNAFQWVREHANLLIGILKMLMTLWVVGKIVTFGANVLSVGKTLFNFGGTVLQVAKVMLPALGTALSGALTSFTGLLAANPIIMVIVTAIGVLIAIGVNLYRNWDTISQYAKKLADFLNDKLTKAVQWLEERLASLREGAQKVHDFLAGAFTTCLNAIKNTFDKVKNAVSGLVDKVKTFLGLNTKKTIEVDVAGDVGENARGTKHWKGGLTWVNEHGSELIRLPHIGSFIANRGKPALLNLPSGTQIIPHGHNALGTSSWKGGDVPGGMITATESKRDVTLNINIGNVNGTRSDANQLANIIYGKVVHALENLA